MQALRCLLAVFLFFSPLFSHAQELHSEVQGVWHATVITVEPLPPRLIPGTDTETPTQRLTAEILEGPRQGERVAFENDFVMLSEGDTFFMNYLVDINGAEFYSVRDPDRLPFLALLTLLFAAVVAILGGKPGLRSLAALALSLLLIGRRRYGAHPRLLARGGLGIFGERRRHCSLGSAWKPCSRYC
jgi:hypothetical protein